MLIVSGRVYAFLAHTYWIEPVKHLQEELCFFTLLDTANREGERKMGAVLWNCLSLILPSSLVVGQDKEYNEVGFLLEVSRRSEMELGLHSEM